jgi:hypothetical protein
LEQFLFLDLCVKLHGFWIRAKIPLQIWISKSWILRYLVLATANPPLSKIRQGVIQGALSWLVFHLDDMHTLTLKIEGDIEFQIGLSLQNWYCLYVFRPSKIAYWHQLFLWICVMREQIMNIKSCFGIMAKIDFDKFPKIM